MGSARLRLRNGAKRQNCKLGRVAKRGYSGLMRSYITYERRSTWILTVHVTLHKTVAVTQIANVLLDI